MYTDLTTLLIASCPVTHATWRAAFWALRRRVTQVCGFVKETQNRLACQKLVFSDVCFKCYTVMKLGVINGVCWSRCSADSRAEECARVTACERGERGGRSPRGPQGPNNWMGLNSDRNENDANVNRIQNTAYGINPKKRSRVGVLKNATEESSVCLGPLIWKTDIAL